MVEGIDYIGVTVCFYCYDGKGKLLLQKRSKEARDEQGRWDCGGGSLRFGEDIRKAVVRELKEEYGCNPLKIDFVGVSNAIRKHNNQKSHWICLVYAVHVNPQEVKIANRKKIDEIGWFDQNHLPQPLHSMYKRNLQLVLRKIKLQHL